MPNDSYISSVLLLILIGLAIYFLSGNKAVTTEPFEDDTDGTNQTDITEENIDEEIEEIDEQPDDVVINDNITYETSGEPSYTINDPQIEQMQMMQNNNVNSSQNNNGNSSQNNNQFIQAPQSEQIMQTPTAQKNVNFNFPQSSSENLNNQLNNFEPNDEEAFNYTGTNLSDAFKSPLEPGVNADVIDFKKGNMDNYDAKDFLPKEINDEWFETDFSLAKYQLNDDKLINTDRYIIGINTVGQSLKNASYDIRGTVPCPKFVISPFNNSTMEPDFNLKPLC